MAFLIVVAMLSRPGIAQADAAEVEALIAKGNELRRAGTPGPALPYFQKAYELARTPRTTGQLGLAELAAGYPVESADHLTAALQTPNDPSIVKYKQMLADALTMARSQIGELTIHGTPAGAEVVIDGRAVGTLPLSLPVRLPARNAEVVVRAPGYSPHREVMPIAGGQRHELKIALERIDRAADAAPVATPAASPPPPPITPVLVPTTSTAAAVDAHSTDSGGSSSGLRTSAWIVGGAALAAAGTGLALNLATRSTSDDQTYDSYKRWSIIGYAGSAALAVTSGVLFWVSRPPSPATSAQAHLTCAPTSNGIACQGLF
jgi:hypothetical protein